MIVRTGRRIPGVVPLGGVHAPISVVRMAVGDAYGAKEWREGEGDDEVAFRTERIERRICRAVAEFAFRQAERTGAKVFGGPEVHRQPDLRGDAQGGDGRGGRARIRTCRYEPQLIDATFALLLASTGDPLVIPGAEPRRRHPLRPRPAALRVDRRLRVDARRVRRSDYEPTALMAEAAHGTAPSLQGKNVANPMAMILAGAALLSLRRRRGRPAGGARDPRGGARGGRATASAPPTSAATRARRSSPTR